MKKPISRAIGTEVALTKYWSQGKLYFVTNGAGDKFLYEGTGNSEYDGDMVADSVADAKLFTSLALARGKIRLNEGYSRPDFGKGKDAKALFELYQDAKVGVLVFKCRDVRIATHMEKGD